MQYFENRLDTLKRKYGIDSFKFDAGETHWCPSMFKYFDSTAYPDAYAQNYIKLAAKQGSFIEARTAHRNQEVGIFYRILDRATDWTIHNGLKSVITATLHFGLLGYPYVLPDIIGGNGDLKKSDKELFIRWTQLTAFLPAMQFGVPPWNFDSETNKICKDFVDLHERLIYPYMIQLPLDGSPIIRPIWWLEPLNIEIFTINDQFLIGDDFLVAPVLDPGIESRTIYFPTGEWYDHVNNCLIVGPVYKSIKLKLEIIPYFISQTYSEKLFPNLNLKSCI